VKRKFCDTELAIQYFDEIPECEDKYFEALDFIKRQNNDIISFS
jgi:hypothetical protein